jgi:hypothetical protein
VSAIDEPATADVTLMVLEVTVPALSVAVAM